MDRYFGPSLLRRRRSIFYRLFSWEITCFLIIRGDGGFIGLTLIGVAKKPARSTLVVDVAGKQRTLWPRFLPARPHSQFGIAHRRAFRARTRLVVEMRSILTVVGRPGRLSRTMLRSTKCFAKQFVARTIPSWQLSVIFGVVGLLVARPRYSAG